MTLCPLWTVNKVLHVELGWVGSNYGESTGPEQAKAMFWRNPEEKESTSCSHPAIITEKGAIGKPWCYIGKVFSARTVRDRQDGRGRFSQ